MINDKTWIQVWPQCRLSFSILPSSLRTHEVHLLDRLARAFPCRARTRNIAGSRIWNHQSIEMLLANRKWKRHLWLVLVACTDLKPCPSCCQMDALMDRGKLPSRLSYRAVGSSTGQAEFKGNGTTFIPENDFASGDIPITTEDYDLFQANNISIVHLPVMVGAISLFHSVPNVPQGGNGLNLTSCLIARIFSLEITDWLDPDITADNPNLRNLIGEDSYPITVSRRSLGSSSTASVTAVSHSCPRAYMLRSNLVVPFVFVGIELTRRFPTMSAHVTVPAPRLSEFLAGRYGRQRGGMGQWNKDLRGICCHDYVHS